MTLHISEIAVQMQVAGPQSLPGGPQAPSDGVGAAAGLSAKDVEKLVERCTAEVLSRLRMVGER